VDSEEDEEIEMEVEPRCKIRLVHEASGLLCRVERLLTANPDDDVETEVETRYRRQSWQTSRSIVSINLRNFFENLV